MTIRKIRRSRARKIQKLAAAGGLAATAGLIGTISEGAYGGTNQNLTPHLATAVAQPANLNAIVASQIALDIPDTVAAAQTAYGSSYAGAWIDNSSGTSVMRIMVAGSSTSSDSSFLGQLHPAAAANTSITHVKYTYAQLQGFQSQIVTYMQNTYPTPGMGPSSWQVSIDPVDNAVTLGLPQANASILPQIEALIPADALRIDWITSANAVNGPGYYPDMNADSFPPYKAGLEALTATGNDCTTGFLLKIDSNYKGVIAGHCDTSSPTDYVYGNGTGSLGEGDGVYSFGSGGDYMVFALTDQSSSDWIGRILAEESPGATLGPSNPNCAECYTPVSSASGFLDNVNGRIGDASQIVGEMSCRAGIHSNAVSCDPITNPAGTAVGYDGKLVGHMACALGYSVQTGDSGGPIYFPGPLGDNTGQAMGVTDVDISYFPSGNATCWTTIDTVLQGLTSTFRYPAYVMGADGSTY